MRTGVHLLMIVVLATLLSGCPSVQSTRALGTLQAEYGDLVRTENGCQHGPVVDEVSCLSDFQAMYGLIEAQADDALVALAASEATGVDN